MRKSKNYREIPTLCAQSLEPRRMFAVDPIGQFTIYADPGLSTPGLTASYIDRDLRGVATGDDWRTTQVVSGTRIDSASGFTSRDWGDPTAVGLTQSSDTDWDKFSVQWDGYIKVKNGYVNLRTRSDDGSRLWIDANRDGQFDTASEHVDNGFNTDRAAATDGPESASLAPGVYPIRVQYSTDTGGNTLQLRGVTAPIVRVAYLIPSNRTAQPHAVENLQTALPIMQDWYRDSFVRDGLSPETFQYETEADGSTPKIHTLKISGTDDYFRADIWTRVNNAASAAGVPLYANNQVWLLIPEIHKELADGTIIGDSSLGASNGSGQDGGVAMVTSLQLPTLSPRWLTNDNYYHNAIEPELGPYRLYGGNSFNSSAGGTFSSVSSTHFGAIVHELTHAFGMPHDFRNDDNFAGNLMGNGFRGFRGTALPDSFTGYNYVQPGQAQVLHNSVYFTHQGTAPERTGPSVTIVSKDVVDGQLRLTFRVADPSGLGALILQRAGDQIGDMTLSGTSATVTMDTPYFEPFDSSEFAVMVYDRLGNRTRQTFSISTPLGFFQAPAFNVAVSKATDRVGNVVTFSTVGNFAAGTTLDWDLDGDGTFETPGSVIQSLDHRYDTPGNYLVRARISQPDVTAVISEAIPVRILPAEPLLSQITGRVFADQNGNGIRDLAEPGLAGVSLYLDQDYDGTRDTNEPVAISDEGGRYTFTGLRSGIYVARAEAPEGFARSSPTAASGAQSMLVVEGRPTRPLDFGLKENVRPRVEQVAFARSPDRVELTFSEDVRPSLGVNDVLLTETNTGTVLDSNLLKLTVDPTGTRATIELAPGAGGRLPAGHWTFALRSAAVTDAAGNTLDGTGAVTFDIDARVIGRNLYYNNSTFDHNTPGADPADDDAIAPNISAALGVLASVPTLGQGNVSSYSQGINGIMIDVGRLPPFAQLDASDLGVRVTDRAAGTWTAGPEPVAIQARPGAGVDGADRIVLTFADGAIINQWLEVTLRPTAHTGLASPDVFYFGNLVANGASASAAGTVAVDASDLVGTRNAIGTVASSPRAPFDFNRDGVVNAQDLVIVRNNVGHVLKPPTFADARIVARSLSIDCVAQRIAPLGRANEPALAANALDESGNDVVV